MHRTAHRKIHGTEIECASVEIANEISRFLSRLQQVPFVTRVRRTRKLGVRYVIVLLRKPALQGGT